MHKTLFNKHLTQRYNVAGPRYTSYPSALQFSPKYNSDDYKNWVNESNNDPIPSHLSLYFHIPFCSSICYYCGCNKIITKNNRKAVPYVRLLIKEIHLQSAIFAKDRQVTQMHWGGGTPTFLNDNDISQVFEETRKSFNFSEDGEYNIEIDPRTVRPDRIAHLRRLGFNRISFGIQDFNQTVQRAVNREQNTKQILDNIHAAHDYGFDSINLDLMYGLPHQNLQRFNKTLEIAISANPDRIAVYNYAHLPERFKPQRRINRADLPSTQQKLEILNLTINKLQSAGYVYIGMDHFAKAGDDLAIAQNNGSLHRNFQGYSTHSECDIIAIGITAISSIGNNYAQNTKTIEAYEKKLNRDELPIACGIELEPDDVLRKEIINQLLCHFVIDIKKLEDKWHFNFFDYFSSVIPQLTRMKNDGLLDFNRSKLQITASGRLLARNICMPFDRYINQNVTSEHYSKTI